MINRLLTIDSRSLKAFRIAFGFWLLWDLAQRWLLLHDLYGGGWIEQAGLKSQIETFRFSLLWMVKTELGLHAIFCLIALAYLSFIFGFFTRIATFLSLIGFLSLVHANPTLLDGGDFITASLLSWTLFLPLSGKESSYKGIAVSIIRLQVGWIYLSAALTKTGLTWKSGHAMWYVWHYDQMATHLGLLLGQLLSPTLMQIITRLSLCLEFAAPLLILFPFRKPIFHRMGILLLFFFQIGIALTVYTGFQAVLSVSLLLFLTTEDWVFIRGKIDSIIIFKNLKTIVGNVLSFLKNLELPLVYAKKVGPLVLTLVWFYFNFGFALMQYGFKGLPQSSQELLKATCITQTWDLFAPDAPQTDGWWLFYGVTQTGEQIDFKTGQLVRFDKPESIFAEYGRQKFKILESLTFNKRYEMQRAWPLLSYFNEFQKSNSGLKFKEARLSYIEEPTPTPEQWKNHQLPATKEYVLWTYFVPQS